MIFRWLLKLLGIKRSIPPVTTVAFRLPRRIKWLTFDRRRFAIILQDNGVIQEKVKIEGENNTMQLFFYFMKVTAAAAREYRSKGGNISVKDTGRYCIRIYKQGHTVLSSLDRFNFSVLPDDFSQTWADIRTVYQDVNQDINTVSLFKAKPPASRQG